MATKSSTQAILTLMQDAKKFKRISMFSKPSVEFYSDYIEAEYRTHNTIRSIPDNHADEWRFFASVEEIVFVFTYYYDPDL